MLPTLERRQKKEEETEERRQRPDISCKIKETDTIDKPTVVRFAQKALELEMLEYVVHISLNYIYTETPPLNQPMRLNNCNCGVIISIVELTEWQCIRDINDLFRTDSLSEFIFFPRMKPLT